MAMNKPVIRGKNQIGFMIDWAIDQTQSSFVALALDNYMRFGIQEFLRTSCGHAKNWKMDFWPMKVDLTAGCFITIDISGVDGIQRAVEFDRKLTEMAIVADSMKLSHKVITHGLIQPRVLANSDGTFWATEDIVANTLSIPHDKFYVGKPIEPGIVMSRIFNVMQCTHFVVLGEMNWVNKASGMIKDYAQCKRSQQNQKHDWLKRELNSNRGVVFVVNEPNKSTLPFFEPETYTWVDIDATNKFLEKIGFETLKVVEFN